MAQDDRGNGEHRGSRGRRPEYIDPVFAKMAVEFVKEPLARASREVLKVAEEALRFQPPGIEPSVLAVLNDEAFRQALEGLAESRKNLPLQAMAAVSDSPQWRQMIESAADTQLVTQQIAPLQDAMRQHAEYIASIVANSAQFEAVTASFARAFDVNWQQLVPNLKQVKQTLRLNLLAAFRRADLWPAPSMPVALLNKIGHLAHGGDPRPVRREVWNYYAHHNHAAVARMIAGWNDDPEFAARHRIFADALRAHRTRLYAVTIPSLLPQVEGIASDFVRGSTAAGSAPRLGKTNEIVLQAFKAAGFAGIANPEDADVLHVVLVEAVIQYIQQVSYETTDFTGQYTTLRTRQRLNRHGILHGIQINYSSAMNSLRCFLLLDALYGLRRHARRVAARAAVAATP